MGLDMYAYATKRALPKSVDFSDEEGDQELHYWRKHPNLHGWMEALYRGKGGAEGDFNLATVMLDNSDLDRLEGDIRGRRLPETSGFFFGQSDGSEIDDDLAFVGKARKAISQGFSVFYVASW